MIRAWSVKMTQFLAAAFVLYAILKAPVASAHVVQGAVVILAEFAQGLGTFFDALLAGG